MTVTNIIVMGVSGCGKSAIGQALHTKLAWPFKEGDTLHPAENIAKMSAGIPLTDADRWPWLQLIANWVTAQNSKNKSTIVTCSALRKVYRDVLRATNENTIFIHLVGPLEILAARLATRKAHFMPSTLLPSQLDTLEPLTPDENGFTVNICTSLDEEIQEILSKLPEYHQ